MRTTTVVNINTRRAPYDVYIGRGSIWGNPYVIGESGTRVEVIQKYEAYVRNRPDLLERLPELEGKTLGCFCYPKQCHGDVLVKLVKEMRVTFR